MNDVVRIEGERIYLRPITEEDTDMVLEWRNSKQVVENFIYRKPITRQEHLNWLATKVDTGKVVQFVICDKKTDRGIGSVYIQNIDMQHQTAEEGIFLGDTEGLGKGIGSEAGRLMVTYAFETLGLHKLSARVLAKNIASQKMHEKAGYTQEGYFKEELLLDGKREDLIFYGIINPADR